MGACATIRLWHRKQDEFFKRHAEFKDAFHLHRASWIESQGLVFPKLLPVLFGTFWLLVHVTSYFH